MTRDWPCLRANSQDRTWHHLGFLIIFTEFSIKNTSVLMVAMGPRGESDQLSWVSWEAELLVLKQQRSIWCPRQMETVGHPTGTALAVHSEPFPGTRHLHCFLSGLVGWDSPVTPACHLLSFLRSPSPVEGDQALGMETTGATPTLLTCPSSELAGTSARNSGQGRGLWPGPLMCWSLLVLAHRS